MNVSRQAGWQSRLNTKQSRLTFRSFAIKVKRYRFILTIPVVTSLLLAAVLVAGCNDSKESKSSATRQGATSSQSQADGKEPEEVYLKAIEQLAYAKDTSHEDGWFVASHSRVFKSDYAFVIPSVKAEFAVAYQKMLDKSGQNLAANISTYVPYSKREAFAREWWNNSEYSKEFKATPVKKQIAWCYESVLDGSELFWRIFEERHPGQVNSAAVLAHDKEQEMVFDYREDEKTPGSFSTRFAAWKELAQNENGAVKESSAAVSAQEVPGQKEKNTTP